MIIHCTKKLAARLPELDIHTLEETSPLGSWHAKLLHFDRRQCLFLCHDQSRAILFMPGVRKADLLNLDNTFPALLHQVLLALGCENISLAQLRLALGPLRFDTDTDRSVLASMTIAAQDLEPIVYQVHNVLELDPVAVSASLTQRPATIRKQWIRPDELLLQQLECVRV